jgi:hypothetical protein
MCEPSNSDDQCLVGFQPLENNLKGLPLGLLDGFILVLSNDSKACGLSVSEWSLHFSRDSTYHAALQDKSIPEPRHPFPSDSSRQPRAPHR